MTDTLQLATSIKWFNRSERIAICECSRPGCPVQFISINGRTRATKQCDDYVQANWRREYYSNIEKPKNTRVRTIKPKAESIKLEGDGTFCLTCRTYTKHIDNICTHCKRERCR